MQASYICPALTPFASDKSVDEVQLKAFVDYLCANHIDGILLGGSSGEFYALSFEEMKSFIQKGIKAVDSRIKLICGTGRCDKEETIELSQFALNEGADAVMLVGPYYSAASEKQIFAYFDEVIAKIDGAVYLYNYPERMGYDISAELLYKLKSRHDNLVGVKDTHSVLRHSQRYIQMICSKYPDFEVYTGYDNNCAALVLSGGAGCIGALSNIIPAACKALLYALRDKDLARLAQLQQEIDRAFSIYEQPDQFNLILKWVLQEAGINFNEIYRAPLMPLSAEQKESYAEVKDLLISIQKKYEGD